MRRWKIWGYQNEYLGVVEANTVGDAMRLARKTWPDQLAGNRLFDIIAVST